MLISKFIKQVSIVASGTAIAQLIGVGVMPLLTRLYSLEEFGIFTIFSSSVLIFGVFATGRYEYAILEKKSDKDAWDVLCTISILSVIFSISILMLVFISHDFIESILSIQVSLSMIFMAGVSIFFTGINLAFHYWLTRQQQYYILSKSRVLGAIVLAFTSSILGFIEFGAEGLIIGMIFGQCVKFLYIIIKSRALNLDFPWPGWQKVFTAAKKNLEYPLYLVPSGILNRFSSQSHILLLSSFFGVSAAGSLGMYQRVIGIPIGLLGRSILDVFRQHASVELNDNGECLTLFYSTVIKLFLLGLTPFVLLLTMAPTMFEFVFGPEWKVAGEYAQILSWIFIFGFVVSPVSSLFLLARKQKLHLIMQIYLLATTLPALYIGHLYEDVFLALTLYTISFCLKYVIDGLISWRIAAGRY
jgi:O-antigen/teichoic acid export membrane protein